MSMDIYCRHYDQAQRCRSGEWNCLGSIVSSSNSSYNSRSSQALSVSWQVSARKEYHELPRPAFVHSIMKAPISASSRLLKEEVVRMLGRTYNSSLLRNTVNLAEVGSFRLHV